MTIDTRTQLWKRNHAKTRKNIKAKDVQKYIW